MKPGKISENVLKRSVLKHIEVNNNKVRKGAGVGTDCAFFAYQGDDSDTEKKISMSENRANTAGTTAIATDTLSLPLQPAKLMNHAVHAALNDLAAEGFDTDGILLNITLPERVREIKLQEMMKQAALVCEKYSVTILGGHTEVTSAVVRPVISVTAVGNQRLAEASSVEQNVLALESATEVKSGKPDKIGQPDKLGKSDKSDINKLSADIVLTKFIGMEAVSMVASVKEEELLSRFPRALVEEAKGFENSLSVHEEAALAMKSGVYLMHDVREGGIFGALWEMAERAGTGLTIDLKKIPMKQTVIEICNYYDLNPYEILSAGCLLIATEDGESLVQKLAENDISSAVIGKMTSGNDRVVQNGEETRFLELPKPDQIRKLLV